MFVEGRISDSWLVFAEMIGFSAWYGYVMVENQHDLVKFSDCFSEPPDSVLGFRRNEWSGLFSLRVKMNIDISI